MTRQNDTKVDEQKYDKVYKQIYVYNDIYIFVYITAYLFVQIDLYIFIQVDFVVLRLLNLLNPYLNLGFISNIIELSLIMSRIKTVPLQPK